MGTPAPPAPPPAPAPTGAPLPAAPAPEPEPATSVIEAAHGSAGPERQVPPNTDEGAGSGCTPGPGDLPDGLWAGYVRSFGDGELSFDLACFITVESAAPERQSFEDFLFENDSPEERVVPVADGATWWLREAVRLVTEPDPGTTRIPATDADALAAYLAETGNTCAVRLAADRGRGRRRVLRPGARQRVTGELPAGAVGVGARRASRASTSRAASWSSSRAWRR